MATKRSKRKAVRNPRQADARCHLILLGTAATAQATWRHLARRRNRYWHRFRIRMYRTGPLVAIGLLWCSPVQATPLRRQLDDHDHDHASESCACVSAEADHTFSLDCNAGAAIATSATTLGECTASLAGCTDNADTACQTAFYHLVFVHGWCDHETLTTEQEELIHTYEDACTSCQIYPPYNSAAEACDTPTCADTAAAQTAYDTLNTTCPAGVCPAGTTCADAALSQAWQTVVAYHDLCAHDDVPTYIEVAYHDFEEPCEDNGCNVIGVDYDGTVCVEETHDHSHEETECDHDDHDHRRRLDHDDDHDEECEHSHTWMWVLLAVVVVGGIGGLAFMKVKELGPFGPKEAADESDDKAEEE
eukprot:COSAG05_NODE_349_length_10936_cov_9.714404_5_plen_362_part_00